MPRDMIFQAKWVVADPWTIIESGYVRVADRMIVEIGQGRGPSTAEAVIDCGPGAIMPGLVNAHTHLELSALQGATETARGLVAWVESVIRLREEIDPQVLIEAAAGGMEQIRASGTMVIGEIASLGLTRKLFESSPVSGVWFREYLGADLASEVGADISALEPGKRFTVAGHAPHTTAPDLLIALKKMADRKESPFGLHLAESEAEVDFLATGRGEWADFMARRGIGTRGWPVTGKSPVVYCDNLDLLNENTLAVHLLECDRRDVAILADRGVRVCVCPRSNRILHGKLPDIRALLDAGIRPCLGTDSLASNDTLNLFDEMAFVADQFPAISPAEILAMGTVNGSEALGFGERFGRLAPGTSAAILYVPAVADKKAALIETIVRQAKDLNVTLLQ